MNRLQSLTVAIDSPPPHRRPHIRPVAEFLMICALLAPGAQAGVHRVQSPLARVAVPPARVGLDTAAAGTLWADSIEYRLGLPSTVFTFGDTVRMVYRITNHMSTQAVFTFGSTCQEWFGVYPDSCGPGQTGCESTWYSGWPCHSMVTYLEIAPGDSAEYVMNWRQHTGEGYPAPPGLYTAYGTLKIQDLFYPLLLSVSFAIVPYGPRPIQEALDAASAGDTVLVGPGVYHENLVLLGQHSGVRPVSEGGPETTIIDGGGRGSVISARVTSSATVIDSFSIQAGKNAASREFYGSVSPGGGIALLYGASPAIRNNIIRNNESTRGGGIAANGGSDVQIDGNLFLDNIATESGGGAYVVPLSGTRSVFSRCTFAGNNARECGGIFYRLGSSSQIHNCIFCGNIAEVDGGGMHCMFPSRPENVCNAFWQNAPDDMFDCDNAVTPLFADPLFCGPEAGDFALRDNSPCAPLINPVCGQVGAYAVGCLAADVSDGAAPDRSELAIAPNPPSGEVRILVPMAWRGLDSNGTRTIEVRPVTGRRIWSTRLGPEAITWDGLDADGHHAPSGIYVVVAREGKNILSTVTLVRVE